MPWTLAELRKRQRMSQRALAQAVGLTSRAISNYESGIRKPPIHVARRIAAVLGVGVDDIVFPGEPGKEPGRAELSADGGVAP